MDPQALAILLNPLLSAHPADTACLLRAPESPGKVNFPHSY